MTHLKLECIMKNSEDVEILRNIILSTYSELMRCIDLSIRNMEHDSDTLSDYRLSYNADCIMDKWCLISYDQINDILPKENRMLIMEYIVRSDYSSHLRSEVVSELNVHI